jgi:hypothetical protein
MQPVFVKELYEAEMSEDADLKANNVVVEVRAKDADTGNTYFIHKIYLYFILTSSMIIKIILRYHPEEIDEF